MRDSEGKRFQSELGSTGEETTLITRRGALKVGAAAIVAPNILTTASASSWRPSKTVRVIVPVTPGGLTDFCGRLVATHLQKSWDRTVVVENRGGAGGLIGTLEFLRAEKDGHAILTSLPGPQTTWYSLYRKLPYERAAFRPISGIAQSANVLAVHPSMPVKSIPEFVAYLRDYPDKVNFGGAPASTQYLAGLWLNQLTKTKTTFVPFPGSAQMALVGNHIQAGFDPVGNYLPLIESGSIRALGVASEEESPFLPNVPVIRKSMPELSRFAVNTWIGLAISSEAPIEAAEAYNAALRELLQSSDAINRIKGYGASPDYKTLQEARMNEDAEIEKWRSVIETEGIKLEL